MSRETLPTEVDIEARLKRGEVEFPPLKLTWDKTRSKELNPEVDGAVRITWQKKTFRFAVECKRLSNPKTLREAFVQARRNVGQGDLFPLVVVPYLSDRSIDELESERVSGIDLCGNGIVSVPGELFVRRTGASNRFQTEGVIKNVYRNSSSVVARLFLAQPEFDSVQDALIELVRRGGRVTLPTVSKVCKGMENDLILERKRGGKAEQDRGTKLRLIQPEKLLERLAENYTVPSVTTRLTGKLIGIESAETRELLRSWADKTKNQIAITGASSVGTYAVMAREGMQEFYCTDVAAAVRLLRDRFQPTDRFPTVSFLETRDEEVYFDRRDDLIASPVQTFLELSSGDKRDKETADQVKVVIMNGISGAKAKAKPRR